MFLKTFIVKEVWKTMGSTKKNFLYNSISMSLCYEFIKKLQEGHPEGKASKLTWLEMPDFMVDLLTSLRTSILHERA